MMTDSQGIFKRFSNFFEEFKKVRKVLGISQEEMGEKLGVSGNYVYLIESGKKIPSRKLEGRFNELKKKSHAVLKALTHDLGHGNNVDSNMREMPTVNYGAEDWKARAIRAETELRELRRRLADLAKEDPT